MQGGIIVGHNVGMTYSELMEVYKLYQLMKEEFRRKKLIEGRNPMELKH